MGNDNMQKQITPRIKSLGRLLIRTFFIYIVFSLSSCAGDSGPGEPVRRTIQSLGTIITVTIYDDPKDEYFSESFRIVRKIHDLMSLEVEESDLNRLNRAAGSGRAVAIDPWTYEVLEEAIHMAEVSDSAFTPAIEPLVSLWDIGGPDQQVPDENQVAQLLPLLDYEQIRLYESADPSSNSPRAELLTPGMGVDLGGIAKGYAADLVSDYLKQEGVKHAILDFGGNIMTIGRKTADRPWTIGLQRPDMQRGVYLGTLPADDLSIVTSGVYERFFIEDDVRYHHLLDSRDGFPADNRLEGVVIVSDVSMTADGYSTAVFVKGLEQGKELVESRNEIEAIFITGDLQVIVSPGLIDQFTLMDDSFSLGEW